MRTQPTSPIALRNDRRNAPLDGLRGLAILLVVLIHSYQFTGFGSVSSPDWWEKLVVAISITFQGVPLFFVLSGFLITSILLRLKVTHADARSFFCVFVVRRALRIIPIYYLFIIGVYFVMPLLRRHLGLHFVSSDEIDWSAALGLALFLTNLPPFHNQGIFIMAWSVCVEMQFYIVWGILVYMLQARMLKGICVCCIVFTFLARISLASLGMTDWNMWHSTPMQLDGLAAGSLIALSGREVINRVVATGWPLIICAGGAIPLLAYVMSRLFATDSSKLLLVGDEHLLKGVTLTLNTVVYSCLLLLVLYTGDHPLGWQARPRRAVLSMFSTQLFAVFGRYSYFVYLFNLYPLYKISHAKLHFSAIPHESLRSLTVFLIVAGLSLILGKVSWTIFEGPIENLKDRLAPRETALRHKYPPRVIPVVAAKKIVP